MLAPRISVVIPVFNNLATLPIICEALHRQNASVPHEIIFVDNGSTDGSVEYLKKIQINSAGYARLFFENKRGAGAARNMGVKHSMSDIILFLGGDILPNEGLLSAHYKFHAENPECNYGCLGYITWDRNINPTPFMIFLEHGGPQNAFDEIAGKEYVDPSKYCYGSNLSLKKELFSSVGGFDAENFSRYGWEDMELGIRLKKRGFVLYYEPLARGWHSHFVTLRDVEKRMYWVGYNYVVLRTLHSELAGFDIAREKKKFWLRKIRGLFYPFTKRRWAYFCEKKYIARRVYRDVLSQAFYIGVHAGMRERGKYVDKGNE